MATVDATILRRCAYPSCPTVFTPDIPKHIYCSRRCVKAMWRKARVSDGLFAAREVQCPVCPTFFLQKSRTHKYCSTACRRTGQKGQVRLASLLPWYICKHCGTRYQPKGRDRKGDFCGRPCSYAYLVVHGRRRQCKDCGTTYERWTKEHKGKRCQPCYAVYVASWTKLCVVCQTTFTAVRVNEACCSNNCKAKYRRMYEDKKQIPTECECLACHRTFLKPSRSRTTACDPCREVQNREREKQWKKANKKYRKAMKRAGRRIPSERFTDEEIFKRDGWCCQMCQKSVSREYDVNHDLYPHLDHIIPLNPRNGDTRGTHTRANVQCLCRKCNLEKRNYTPEDVQLRLVG
jgi:HNH endonuclease